MNDLMNDGNVIRAYGFDLEDEESEQDSRPADLVDDYDCDDDCCCNDWDEDEEYYEESCGCDCCCDTPSPDLYKREASEMFEYLGNVVLNKYGWKVTFMFTDLSPTELEEMLSYLRTNPFINNKIYTLINITGWAYQLQDSNKYTLEVWGKI